jgi:hypothetical protein
MRANRARGDVIVGVLCVNDMAGYLGHAPARFGGPGGRGPGGFGGARKHGMMMGDETEIRNWP